MDIVWIRKSISEWISINIDEIKSFSYDSRKNCKSKFLYINHKLIVRDDELILFKALEEFMRGGNQSRYLFDDSISQYNKLIKDMKYRKVGD